ncbi:MAG: hypothetical protein ACXVHQ_37195, partial [Solirubrobacteraceae bacterium]
MSVVVVEGVARCGDSTKPRLWHHTRDVVRVLWLRAGRGLTGSWGQNSASRVRAWCAIGVRATAGEEAASGAGPVDR